MPKVHGHRALLNRSGHQSTAAIVAEIEDTGPVKDGQKRSKHRPSYPMIQLSNCDRSISFEVESFHHHNTVGERREAMANDLHKIDTLVEALTKFREGLVVEQERYWKRKSG